MKKQLVTEELLQKSKKILFVTNFALGDYTYAQTYFKRFAQKYAHAKIDLWIDEARRTRCFWRWHNLKRYALYDWVRASEIFNTVYDRTYCPQGLKDSVCQAQQENYDLVISLAQFREHAYASFARLISPKAFIAGTRRPIKKYNFSKKRKYDLLDASFGGVLSRQEPITDRYAQWFEDLFGVCIEPEKRGPFIAIPREWISYAKLRFFKYGIMAKDKRLDPVFFINVFAENKKQSWPVKYACELVALIKKEKKWGNASFFINTSQDTYCRVKTLVQKRNLKKTHVFTAHTNFFQLPAIMSLCDVVVSVESSTIHIAHALNVPVITLGVFYWKW